MGGPATDTGTVRMEGSRLRPAALGFAAAMILAVIAAAALGLGQSTAAFRADILLPDARAALARNAALSLRAAVTSEKDAMVMVGQSGLDDQAAAWMTAIQHLRAASAGLGLLADTPEERAALGQIDAAIDAYVAAGEAMYRLKRGSESADAIAISNGAAERARTRIETLLRARLDAAAGAADARAARYERAVGEWLATALGLSAAIAAAAWLGTRRRPGGAPALAGE